MKIMNEGRSGFYHTDVEGRALDEIVSGQSATLDQVPVDKKGWELQGPYHDEILLWLKYKNRMKKKPVDEKESSQKRKHSELVVMMPGAAPAKDTREMGELGPGGNPFGTAL
jgi:hypothetical protein